MSHTMHEEEKKPHDGRNVKRIREILKVKQSALASELGDDWNQKKVSQLEDKEVINDKLMEEIAAALKVPVEAIKNYTEDSTYSIFGNTVSNNNNVAFIQNNPILNPLEKWMEAIEENRKLYERLLQSEREKVEMLQQIVNEKKQIN